jgi:hypothetical protein
MLNVNVYLFILAGDSLNEVVAVKSGEDFISKLNRDSYAGFYPAKTALEKIQNEEKVRDEAFAEIAFAAVKDRSNHDGEIEKLQDYYGDILPHFLAYVGIWTVEKSELEIFIGKAFSLDSFVVACGKAFLSNWSSYGTAWTAVFEIEDSETGEVSYRHSDVQAEI